MIVKNGTILGHDFTFSKRDLFVSGDRFSHTGEGETVDATDLYVIPGLVDIHLHGSMGADFSDATHEAFDVMAEYQASQGVTAFNPATLTLSEATLEKISTAAASYPNNRGSIFTGITLEGPFFSAEKKGAQNGEYLRVPDLKMFHSLQEKSGGKITIACIAPELTGAIPFVKEVGKTTTVAIAHTMADYDTAVSAFQAGATHVTHLFNAMPPFLHRDPSVVGAAADSDAFVELITDGHHIHPSMIRATFKLFGKDRMILVSDSLMAAGLGDGDYTLGEQAVRVENTTAYLKSGTIAGSAIDLMECLRRGVSFGLPLENAVQAASANPAKQIKREHDMGSIQTGKLANFVLLTKDLEIDSVYIKGKKFHPKA